MLPVNAIIVKDPDILGVLRSSVEACSIPGIARLPGRSQTLASFGRLPYRDPCAAVSSLQLPSRFSSANLDEDPARRVHSAKIP